jgi:nucleotide-binding universal stress UspA family protein
MKKVLVATDFSPHAASAQRHAVELAKLFGASIELFTSAYIPPQALAAMAIGMAPGLIQEARDQSKKQIEAAAAELRSAGVVASTSVSTDEPSSAICARASEIGADLVATGTRGHTGLAHVVFGSIAERVARLAQASVLTAHADTPAPAGYRRVLVPSDFSPDSERALELARTLVAKSGGKLYVMHSYDLPALLTGGAAVASASLEQALQDAARDKLAALKATLSGVDVETVLDQGRPDMAALETAERVKAELIVMGTRGRTGLAHVVLGSTAERVIRRAHAPVIAVKAKS